MRDPLLIVSDEQPVPEQRIPDEWRAKYLDRDISKLPTDVLHAFDDIHELRKQRRRDKDLIIAELIATRRRLKWAKRQIWIMSLLVSPILGAAAKALIDWLVK